MNSRLKKRQMFSTACLTAFMLCISLIFRDPSSVFAQIRFEDVSDAAGFSRWGDSFGASWGDFNKDGWPDLWLGNHCADPALYRNNANGTFTDVSDLVKHNTGFEQHAAAWADFDNDGDQDLIQVVGGAREERVYQNQFFVNHKGLLLDKADEYGLGYPLGRGRTPLWFDWNSDGLLDVFITNLIRSGEEKAPSVLFTSYNDNFQNDNGVLDETDPLHSQFAQLFIAHCKTDPAIVLNGWNRPYPYRIYQYNKAPFNNITDTMSFPVTDNVYDVSIADFNNDLLNDFFMATATWGSKKIRDRLLIQTPGGFKDSTEIYRLHIPTNCRSVVSADFDNDMDMDIYLVCSGVHCNIPNILYENLGNGTFRTLASAGGAQGSSYGRGDSATVVDFDNNGFVDLFVTNRRDTIDRENSHNKLYRNIGNNNHWLEINLEGVVSNRDGIGALLMASSNGITQMRVQGGGIHKFSQDHQRIHFGLLKNTLVDKLVIQWPSGIIQEISDVNADQIITITELDFTSTETIGKSPLQVSFSSNTRGRYKPIRYEWDFNNDGEIDSTRQNPRHIYNLPGIFTVKLIITDMNGKIHTSTRENYIIVK